MKYNTVVFAEFVLFLYTIKLNCSPCIGGFLPGVKQIANVAALPGIVGVKMIITFSCWNYNSV